MVEDIRYLVKMAGMTYAQLIEEMTPYCREANWEVPNAPNLSEYLKGSKGDLSDQYGKARFIRNYTRKITAEHINGNNGRL